MTSAYHPAKIGDIIYSLPAVHRRGGVSTYFIKRPEVAKYLKRLFESQSYIDQVVQSDNPPAGVTIDFSNYQSFYRLMLRCDLISLNCMVAGVRTHQFPLKVSGVSLSSKHVKYMNCDIDLDENRDLQMWRPNQRWLDVEPVHESDIIINLTERYHDWNKEKHNPAFHFDSKLFVGAASSAKAIAEGLKHPTLMEISKDWPDDLPKHAHGHYHINKEIIEYYLNNDIPQATLPEIEIKENKEEGLEEFFS